MDHLSLARVSLNVAAIPSLQCWLPPKEIKPVSDTDIRGREVVAASHSLASHITKLSNVF